MARAVTDRPEAPPRLDVLESFDPATGDVVGSVPVTKPGNVEKVAQEVERIQKGWALVPLPERLRIMRNAVQVLIRRRDEIAMVITRENGKTISESAAAEVTDAISNTDWVARYGARYLSPERIPDPVPLLLPTKRHWVTFEPLGVVGIISPWNWPFMIPFAEVAHALAAGNGVLLKPSELTPLCGDEIAKVFAEAGLPDGVLRVIHGYGDTGAALCEAGPVRKIFFTGSTTTGRKVMETAAKHMKPVVLELGGKDPAVVLADADIDRTAEGILWNALGNCGQTCAGVERVYVDRRIHDRFVDRLVEEARRVRPGDPKDPDTQIGPLNNDMQYGKVLEQLDDAVEKGAKVEVGGPEECAGLPHRYVAPTVLTGVDHSMRVMREETFGPLLPVMAFDDEREAVQLANDSDYGLGASVWTRDLRRGRMLADRIEAGMVWVNDHAYSHGFPQTPWGGVKGSGSGGVTHSKFGLYEMVDKKLVADDRGLVPDPWWYPYSSMKAEGFIRVMDALYSRGRRARTLWKNRRDLVSFAKDLLA